MIVSELLQTERTYVATLGMLVTTFLKPLRKAASLYDVYEEQYGKTILSDIVVRNRLKTCEERSRREEELLGLFDMLF